MASREIEPCWLLDDLNETGTELVDEMVMQRGQAVLEAIRAERAEDREAREVRGELRKGVAHAEGQGVSAAPGEVRGRHARLDVHGGGGARDGERDAMDVADALGA